MIAKSSTPIRKKTVVLITSSAPFGMSEIWFQAEVRELQKSHNVILAPIWPRGTPQLWPGTLFRSGGRPKIRAFSVLRILVTSSTARKMLTECRKTSNLRTGGKCVIAVLVALQWSIDFSKSELEICHVHATTVGAPAIAAVVLAERLRVSSSATAHRGDILRHSPISALRQITLIRAISERAKRRLADLGVNSVVLKFGAVDFVLSDPPQHFGERLQCVAVGHLIARKGHVRAIRMVNESIKGGLNVELDIFGVGPLKEELLAEVDRLGLRGKVRFQGMMAHPKLLAELSSKRWNVLIHTSIQSGEDGEGIPVAVLEAAACGVAIIASDSGATAEFVQDGKNGFLISASDESIAVEMGLRALKILSANALLRDQISKVARDSVQHYLASNTVHEMKVALAAMSESEC